MYLHTFLWALVPAQCFPYTLSAVIERRMETGALEAAVRGARGASKSIGNPIEDARGLLQGQSGASDLGIASAKSEGAGKLGRTPGKRFGDINLDDILPKGPDGAPKSLPKKLERSGAVKNPDLNSLPQGALDKISKEKGSNAPVETPKSSPSPSPSSSVQQPPNLKNLPSNPSLANQAEKTTNAPSRPALPTRKSLPSNPSLAKQAERTTSAPSHPALPTPPLSPQNLPNHPTEFSHAEIPRNPPTHQNLANQAGANTASHQNLANQAELSKNLLSHPGIINQAKSSTDVASHPIPQSLAAYKTKTGYAGWDLESYSERFLLDTEPAEYEDIYLDLIHESAQREVAHTEAPHTEVPHTEAPHTEASHTEAPHTEAPHTEPPHAVAPIPIHPDDLARSTKEIERAGTILQDLSAEEKLRGTVDIDFMARRFRNEWMERIPPEHRDDVEVLKQVDQVEQHLKQMLYTSKAHAKVQKDIEATTKPWKQFERHLGRALHDSLPVYVKEETDKVVQSQLAEIFDQKLKQWKSIAVRPVAESVVDDLIEKIDDKGLLELYQMATFARSQRENLEGVEKLDSEKLEAFKTLLVERLSAPEMSAEEFRFLSEGISKRNYGTLMQLTDKDLMALTPEIIGTKNQLVIDDILHFRLQFSTVKAMEKSAEDSAKQMLKLHSEQIAGNQNLMKSTYEQKLATIFARSNRKVEAQFFQKNFGIERSADDMYNQMKDMGHMWNVDLVAFERNFKYELPPREYQELSEAASRSRLYYQEVLGSIVQSRKIDRYKFLEAETLKPGQQYQQAVPLLLKKLHERGVVKIFDREIEYASGSNRAAKVTLDQVKDRMRIGVFDKLEAEAIQQSDLSPVTSSITNFLDELATKRLITQEERDYFFPRNIPKNSPPLLLVQEFSKKVDQLSELPRAFIDRLISSLTTKFDSIPRDAKFQSETLARKSEEFMSSHQSEIDKYLRRHDYKQAVNDLQSSSIARAVDDHMWDEGYAVELWDDHFQREYISYKLQSIEGPKDQIGGPAQPKIVYSKELIDKALSELSKTRIKSTDSELPKPTGKKGKLLPSVRQAQAGASGSEIGKSGEIGTSELTAGKSDLAPGESALKPDNSQLKPDKNGLQPDNSGLKPEDSELAPVNPAGEINTRKGKTFLKKVTNPRPLLRKLLGTSKDKKGQQALQLVEEQSRSAEIKKGELAAEETQPALENLEPEPQKIVQKVTDKSAVLPDERHFVLLTNPLKPARSNTGQESVKLADERLKDTPFRYLNKDILDEWNGSVEFMSRQINPLLRNIDKKDTLFFKLQNEVLSLGQYNEIMGDLVQQVNSKFTTSQPGIKGLYKLTPEATDPRVRSSFLGPRL
ncbi:hypothetical protein MJO29_007944 [Puccinia striiformis f. sp. tritici]|uniref:Uncharacterized protein n=1 Tax=Puccinia striiformis TaxID=27350 RepID=A0A2S4UJ35_9BASI|nr:hypothetical protein MJO29_007944 [Puccinia striiformis f. sp. tritici]POV97332.1 hypothetical protein PSHT_14641 [Puccinia striiformis]